MARLTSPNTSKVAKLFTMALPKLNNNTHYLTGGNELQQKIGSNLNEHEVISN